MLSSYELELPDLREFMAVRNVRRFSGEKGKQLCWFVIEKCVINLRISGRNGKMFFFISPKKNSGEFCGEFENFPLFTTNSPLNDFNKL